LAAAALPVGKCVVLGGGGVRHGRLYLWKEILVAPTSIQTIACKIPTGRITEHVSTCVPTIGH
jgi:hypothetical protein